MDVVSFQEEEEGEVNSENPKPTTDLTSSSIAHTEQAPPSPVIDEREENIQLIQVHQNGQTSRDSNNVEGEHHVKENGQTASVIPETSANYKRPASSIKLAHHSAHNDYIEHQQQGHPNTRLYLTHVNLTLESIKQRPLSSNAWRAQNIKKNFSQINHNYNNQAAHTNSGNSFSVAPSPDLTYDAKFQNNRPKSCKICTHSGPSAQNKRREEPNEQNAIGDKQRSHSPVQQQLNNSTQQVPTLASSIVSRAQSCKVGKRSKPHSELSEASNWYSSYSTKSYRGDRSKSSIESVLDTERSSGRHTYSVAAFNKFKNNLLRSRNYSKPHMKTYFYNQNGNQVLRNNLNNLNDNFRKSLNITADKVSNTKRPVTSTIYHSLHNRDSKTSRPFSQIRSIYEIIQRDHNHNQAPVSNTDFRRSNYIQTLSTTQHLLASSLLIKKLEQN